MRFSRPGPAIGGFAVLTLLATGMYFCYAICLIASFDNAPVLPGPDFQARRFELLKACQDRNQWLSPFKNRGVGQDCLDETAAWIRSRLSSVRRP